MWWRPCVSVFGGLGGAGSALGGAATASVSHSAVSDEHAEEAAPAVEAEVAGVSDGAPLKRTSICTTGSALPLSECDKSESWLLSFHGTGRTAHAQSITTIMHVELNARGATYCGLAASFHSSQGSAKGETAIARVRSSHTNSMQWCPARHQFSDVLLVCFHQSMHSMPEL